MFNRWRKEKEVSGIECPLCNQVSPEGTEECSRCYYQLVKGTLEKEDSIEPKVSSDLFEELMSEDDDDDDDDLVDWSRHAFEIDEVTIDVDQYEEESDVVAISAAPSFASFGDSAPNAGDRDTKKLDEGEYELSVSDAPKDVERFVVPEHKREEELAEVPVHKVDLVVPLLPKGQEPNGDDEGPLADPSEIPDDGTTAESTDDVTEPAAEPGPEPEPEPEPEPTVTVTATPVSTDLAPSATPALPATPGNATPSAASGAPKLPSIPIPTPNAAQNGELESNPFLAAPTPAPTSTSKAPALPAQPQVRPPQGAFEADLDLDVNKAAVAPETAPSRSDEMWPWSQQQPHDDLTVRRELRQVMEMVKAGDLGNAERALDALGPHLGDRKDILFHVGVVLKKLGREEALRRMLENARRLHPEDQHVATALTSLGM